MQMRIFVGLLAISLFGAINSAFGGGVPLSSDTTAANRGIVNFNASGGNSLLDIDVEFAVYAPGDYTGTDPSAGDEWVYAYQIFNDLGGTTDLTSLSIGKRVGAITANPVSDTSPLVGVGGGIAPSAVDATGSAVSYSFIPDSLDPNEFSRVLLFTSPQSWGNSTSNVLNGGLTDQQDLPGPLAGDLNNNQLVNCDDIDLMREAILNATSDPLFNVDGQGGDTPNEADFDFLVTDVLGTARGDADLNFIINFADFVALSNNFNLTNTGWKEGNFNLDNNTNFEDFVELANRFGQTFPLSPAVPEPTGALLLSLAPALFSKRLRRKLWVKV